MENHIPISPASDAISTTQSSSASPKSAASIIRSPERVPFFANAVYYPNWIVYKNQPPSSLNLGFVSHVFYAFAHVNQDGTVYLSDEWADAQMPVDGETGCLRALTKLKTQHSQLRIILSIGGGSQGETFSRIVHNPSHIETFAITAKKLVEEYNLDGIDIDWEHPKDLAEGNGFYSLLQRVRSYFPRPRYILSAALPVGAWALKHLNLALLHEFLEGINLMAYDFCGVWKPTTGHQSQLYSPSEYNNLLLSLATPDIPVPSISIDGPSGNSGVRYLLENGVPPNKILFGIPTYGRSFLGAFTINQPYTGLGGQDGVFEYRDLPRPETQEYTNEELGAGCCIGGDGGFVTYDTVKCVKKKAAYVKEMSLGGLFYWHIGSDRVGDKSLVKTGYNALHELDENNYKRPAKVA